MASPAATFAYTLQLVDGIGRVTAHRLLKHFGSHQELTTYPREQILTRMKGSRGAEAILARLLDHAAMQALHTQAEHDLDLVTQKRVEVVSPRDPAWPAGLGGLPLSSRPVLLYAYGRLEALAAPTVALFARPPLASAPYEQAQTLARRLFAEGVLCITGASSGFDVVIHKLAGAAAPPKPSAMVVPCGMARLPGPMRPPASGLVKAGGVVLSPFPMAHGPYDHDDHERALVQAALAGASIFVEPQPGTAEWAALQWAVEAGRPAFAVAPEQTGLPEGVQPVTSASDVDLILRTLPAAGRHA